MSKADDARLAAWIVDTFRDDPAGYMHAILKMRPQRWQERFLSDIATSQRVAYRSGHGVGKTTANCVTIHWFMATRHLPKIIVTANTGRQLESQTWADLSSLNKNASNGHLFTWRPERFYLNEDRPAWFATPRTWDAGSPESFQGEHRRNIMLAFDEASSIPYCIYEAAEGSMSTAGSKWVLTGNPTRPSGYFYDVFHMLQHIWKTGKISCFDGDYVDPMYADRIAVKYGLASNVYRIRVLGEFPLQGDDSIIPLAHVEDAMLRDAEADGELYVGVDVARYGGDATAIAGRQSKKVWDIKEYRKLSTMETTGRVIDACREYEDISGTPVSAIFVDVIGVGAGVADRLREQEYPVVDVNVSNRVEEKYSRTEDSRKMPRPAILRDELWLKMQAWFAGEDVSLPKDEGITVELVTPRYAIDSSGRWKVEAKDSLKKRGFPSPNKADALALTFARPRVKGIFDYYASLVNDPSQLVQTGV